MNAMETPARVSSRTGPAYRPFPAEAVLLLVIVLAIGLLAAAYFGLWSEVYPYDGTFASSELDTVQAAALVERTASLATPDTDAAIWSVRLTRGQASLGDYLLRVFTSPVYLARQPDDRTFISDAFMVLTGATPDDTDISQAEAELARTGSRLAYLNRLVTESGYRGVMRLPAGTTRIRTCTLVNNRPPAGSETVGIMTIEAEIRLTGSAARLRLYSDGLLHSQQDTGSVDPSVQNTYRIDWDTRREYVGSHKLAFLLQTSDGRGAWFDLESYIVPDVLTLANGQTVEDRLSANNSNWYSLPAQNGLAYLTLAETSGPLQLEMFSLYAKSLATAEAIQGQPAALRALTGDEEAVGESICYARITAQEAADYQMAAAYAAARPADGGRLLSVQAVQEEEVLILDSSGVSSWQPADQYRVYDPTARLSRLDLRLPDGSLADYASHFDPDTGLYGLVVDAGTSQLQLSALAMEGSAAGLKIERLGEMGQIDSLGAEDTVPLALSENLLQITVTGFDGSVRTYEINILRPPHSGGFDRTLEPFPADYRSPLWLLHIQRPAWQFKVLDTGLDWTSFIDAQDETDRSLVSASSSPASWIEPGSPVYDGTSWKAAARPVIEHFADPRHFLNEIDIFQFEKMVYNPAIHNRSGLNAVIGNSFMADGNSQGIDYASLLIRAGETAGISPYYLAAKIIQEVGYNGESLLASGTLPDYEGFYNFYNIGATPNPSVVNGALINGARYAQYGRLPDEQEITEDEAALLLPWNTPERAITGGAIWIAQRYIQIGQDTLYLQKFDLIDDDSLYTHQYAQNIQMAWSEARNTRRAYVGSGLLDEAFIFDIPVFAGMPDVPVMLP